VRYFLDTNIASDMIRNPRGQSVARFNAVDPSQVAVSVVVAAELRFGAIKRALPVLSARVRTFLANIDVIPFAHPADRFYAEIRHRLEERGLPIGANDLFIAAHALALDRVVVTDNEAEFSRVEGLRVENWLR
jgi:tRNA(fMet)-specific endonuclease VapC